MPSQQILWAYKTLILIAGRLRIITLQEVSFFQSQAALDNDSATCYLKGQKASIFPWSFPRHFNKDAPTKAQTWRELLLI